MVDREKVVANVTEIVSDMQEEVDEWKDYSDSELSHGLTCDCDWWYKTLQTLKDALALLKEQEPIAPVKVNRHMETDENGDWFSPETYDCGYCGVELHGKANYCHLCGRAVKWE